MTSGGSPIAGIPDLGTNNSVPAQVLASTGTGSALPIPILWPLDQSGVNITSDALMGAAAAFNTSSCIEFANLSTLARTVYDACLFDPAQCPFGLSAAVWVRFPLSVISATATQTALLASGPTSGFYLYQMGPATYVSVYSSSGTWYNAYGSSRFVQPNQWVCIGFTWSAANGAHIFVNDYDLNSNGAGQSSTQTTSSVTGAPSLSIGCNGGSFAGPISIANAAVWYYRLRSESREQSFLSGGLLLNVMRYQTTTTSVAATLPPNWVSQRFDYSTSVELTFPASVGALSFKQDYISLNL